MRPRLPGAAEDVFHARQQFFRFKRLEHIVLRAHAQPAHAVRNRRLRRQKQYGNGPLHHCFGQRKAVLAGQHDIQNRQIRRFFFHHATRLPCVLRRAHVIADQRQLQHHNLPNGRVVFDQQKVCHAALPPFTLDSILEIARKRYGSRFPSSLSYHIFFLLRVTKL